MAPNGILKILGVSHAYGETAAVTGVDLSVASGEVVCLVGPSGCGKSTVLRLAAGLEYVQAGKIELRGAIVGDGAGRHLPPEKRHVGLVFQDFALFPHLTVSGNVGFGLVELPEPERGRRIQETLRQVGLHDVGHVYPHALSGGQQQRVALARALAPKPSLMLMDEPFSGLDERLREQVRDETLHVLRRAGAASLLVTHDPVEALFMADRIYLMREGRIVQAGTPREIYDRPANLFAARFFSTINHLRGTIKDGMAHTALGSFGYDLPKAGPHLTIAFRPESVSIGERAAGRIALSADAIVEELHFLGADWRLRLVASAPDAPSIALVARGTGRPPEIGARVAVSVAAERVFVFAGDD